MRHDYYRFAKASNNIWKGYGPGTITTFTGEAAEAMDAWSNFVYKFNKKIPIHRLTEPTISII